MMGIPNIFSIWPANLQFIKRKKMCENSVSTICIIHSSDASWNVLRLKLCLHEKKWLEKIQIMSYFTNGRKLIRFYGATQVAEIKLKFLCVDPTHICAHLDCDFLLSPFLSFKSVHFFAD